MTGRLAITAKTIGATPLALAIGAYIWAYIAVHPLRPSLWYNVDTGRGQSAALVSVGGPDTAGFSNGNEGYVWEIRPISISPSQAVIDFRLKHFNYSAPFANMRAELAEFPFRRLILRPKQPLSIEAPDGAKVSLSGTIY